jgi:hypothetical protein
MLLQRSLTWAEDDLSLQNIQARARAPLAWRLANVRQAILLTTSNRSEAAVGYATMDGDTAGGLAPLAGIDKQFLRSWLVWAEHSCSLGLGAVSALHSLNVQQPTAELRPPGAGQRDEDDLILRRGIGMAQAALGSKLIIPTLDGERTIDVPAGIQHGHRITLAGVGVPHLKGIGRGDLHVQLEVVVPRKLSKEQRELLEKFAAVSGEDAGHQGGFFHKIFGD